MRVYVHGRWAGKSASRDAGKTYARVEEWRADVRAKYPDAVFEQHATGGGSYIAYRNRTAANVGTSSGMVGEFLYVYAGGKPYGTGTVR